MSRLALHRFSKICINNYSRSSKSHSTKLSHISHALLSSVNSTDKTHSNPLYTSYAKIRAVSDEEKAKQPILSSSSPSPLLTHLNLIDSNNSLKSINWENWDELREIFNKTMIYYINDFCNQFGYDHANNNIICNDFIKRTHYMLIKTNMGGKNNRGLLHMISLLLLRQHSNISLSTTDIHNSLTIALCIEALQSYFLVMDDVVDGSITRRGQPCWYRFPNVGLKAVNDGPIIEHWLFWLINNRLIHNGNMILIDRLNELFREINMLTLAGQSTDLELVKDANKMREIYTLNRYETIAMYKASFYTFYLPYAAALYLAGYDDKNEDSMKLRNQLNINNDGDNNNNEIDDGFLFHICRQLSIEMGIKFQIDDDYLDCFGDPKITGKEGTDIQDFKCSWIVVKALELMNDKQYEILKKHYGKKTDDDVKIVKELYKELDIENVYKKWESNEHKKLMAMVEQCEGILPTKMFTLMLDKLHKRNK